MGKEDLKAAIENYRSGTTIEDESKGHVVCTCFGVTEDEIKRVITENSLATVEDITNYSKAGSGCRKIINKVYRKTVTTEVKEKRSDGKQSKQLLTT